MKECLLSIQEQTYSNYEVWVIDGGSVDGTKAFLKTVTGKVYFISEKDSGIYDAMNKGVNKGKGKWFLFLGTDDKLFDNKVLETVFGQSEYEKKSLIIGNVVYSSSQQNKESMFFNSSFSRKLWIKNTVHHQSVFYRNTIFKYRKYNLNYKVLSDYSLNLFLYKDKIPHIKLKNTIAVCAPGGVSKQYNWDLYREEALLKIEASNIIFSPFFYLLSSLKFLIRKIYK